MVRAPDSPARRRRKGEMVPRFLRGRDRGEHGWQGAFKRLLQPFSRSNAMLAIHLEHTRSQQLHPRSNAAVRRGTL